MSFALLYSLVRFSLDPLLTRRQNSGCGLRCLPSVTNSGFWNARSGALAGSPPTASRSPPWAGFW